MEFSLETYCAANGLDDLKLDPNSLKICDKEKLDETSISPGREAVTILIGTLAVSHFVLTSAFINFSKIHKANCKELKSKLSMIGCKITTNGSFGLYSRLLAR